MVTTTSTFTPPKPGGVAGSTAVMVLSFTNDHVTESPPTVTFVAPVNPEPLIVRVSPAFSVEALRPVTVGEASHVQSSAVAGLAVLGRPVLLTTAMVAVVPPAPLGVAGTVA